MVRFASPKIHLHPTPWLKDSGSSSSAPVITDEAPADDNNEIPTDDNSNAPID
jgi:hypothetical protein